MCGNSELAGIYMCLPVSLQISVNLSVHGEVHLFKDVIPLYILHLQEQLPMSFPLSDFPVLSTQKILASADHFLHN